MSKRNKYNAKKITDDGITFDSLAEHARYCELKILLKAGAICGLQVHTRWPLHCGNQKVVGYYESDFDYFHGKDPDASKRVVEDVKGLITQLASWKIRHFEAQYFRKVTIINMQKRRRAA